MNPHVNWSRRTFLSAASLTAAAAISPRQLVAEPLASPATIRSFLAYVGFSSSNSTVKQRIETYRVEAGKWLLVGEASPCEAPHALVMHPTLPVLYVAHSTAQYLGLPRGSVSTFTVNSSSGELWASGREALALSAIHPEHLAISPNGSKLIVSAGDGGSYNTFSLAADGIIVPGPNALKQTGCGPHIHQTTARPHSVIFHSSGSAVYASDLGADRINHITFAETIPSVSSRVSLTPGSGPGYLALHPSGKIVVVSSQLRSSLSVLTVDENSGQLRPLIQQVTLDAEAAGPLCFDPAGRSLYVACRTTLGDTTVIIFRVGNRSFRLRTIGAVQVPSMGQSSELLVRAREILLIGEGGVASLPLDQRTGLFHEPKFVVRRRDAVSIALLPL